MLALTILGLQAQLPQQLQPRRQPRRLQQMQLRTKQRSLPPLCGSTGCGALQLLQPD